MIYGITKLGYDIDGVLAEFSEHFLRTFCPEDMSGPLEWSDPRFKDNFHKTYNNKEFWMTVPALVFPQDLPIKPHCYITARPIPNEWTMEWLWKNKFPYAPLYTVGEDKSKVEVFRESGATHFIDDALHNFAELNNAGIPCFLLTRSHNTSKETDMRVDSLRDLPMALINHRFKYLSDQEIMTGELIVNI
jgi:hypothetical protein